MPVFQELPLLGTERINRAYLRISVMAPELAEKCRPGMFFELKAGLPSQTRRLFKPISVFEASEGKISFLIKVVGPGTRALAELKPGEPLLLLGPLGNSFHLVKGQNALLVSGGIGYPPLAWLKRVLEPHNRVILVHGGSCAEDLFPCDRGYTLDGSSGDRGLVTQDIMDIIKTENIDIVYSCGPLPMLKALQACVGDLPHYASLEAYMACGLGACHGCAVPVGEGWQRVCKDGPVFAASLIRWEEL
ncbi:MAG: dihydroorotate dehydrogenase electron transfer subunit [Candidatus Cloacimonetes bacterium]|nr:dihydroorotate dehydrogenase electron transfer subunit [Candidatus Cloacimonadota bacterium]